MKYYGKSEDTVKQIIDQFKSGQLPKALSQVFVNRSDNIPSGAWSWNNRFIMAIHGTSDARGFKQWNDAGRKVSKGSKAFHILGPCKIKKQVIDDKTGEVKEVPVLIGFRSIPVFALESTEVTDADKWEKVSGLDEQEENRLSELPYRNVAESWGLNVTSYNGKNRGSLGYYSYNGTIALGVENLATWAHELCHAADDKLGTITKAPGQQVDNEIVAELAGATLLQITGEDIASDIGGAWDYILSYSKGDENKAVSNCFKFLDRICNCLNLILETAESIESDQAQKIAA